MVATSSGKLPWNQVWLQPSSSRSAARYGARCLCFLQLYSSLDL